MRHATILLRITPLLACLALAATGCSALGELGFQRPDVAVEDVRLQDLSFTGVDLLFDLEVDNPNPFDVVLGRIDWGLSIAGRDLLHGEQREGLAIPARGRELARVPVSLRFADLFEAVRTLRGRERADYELGADLWFDVPVVGSVKVPVSKRGEVPLRP